MTEDQGSKKPEWFEMAEADASPVQKAPSRKRLPIIALVATGAILSAGAVFANVNENEPADASNFRGGNFQPNPNFTPDGKNFPKDESFTAGSRLPRPRPTSTDGPMTLPRQDEDGDHQFTPGERPKWDEDGDGEEHHRFPDGEGPRHRDRNGLNPNGGTSTGNSGGIPTT